MTVPMGIPGVYPEPWVPNQPISAGLGTHPGYLWVTPGVPRPKLGRRNCCRVEAATLAPVWGGKRREK